MTKAIGSVKLLFISLISFLALFIGTTSASSATAIFTHQPKCPEELLK